jgi:hypothetical protein
VRGGEHVDVGSGRVTDETRKQSTRGHEKSVRTYLKHLAQVCENSPFVVIELVVTQGTVGSHLVDDLAQRKRLGKHVER